jgi:hypothetical protein
VRTGKEINTQDTVAPGDTFGTRWHRGEDAISARRNGPARVRLEIPGSDLATIRSGPHHFPVMKSVLSACSSLSESTPSSGTSAARNTKAVGANPDGLLLPVCRVRFCFPGFPLCAGRAKLGNAHASSYAPQKTAHCLYPPGALAQLR